MRNWLRNHRLLILTAVLVALLAMAAFYLLLDLPAPDFRFLLPPPDTEGNILHG